MARIVQYEQQTQAGAGRLPTLANAPPALDAGSAGGGFQDLARGLGRLGEVVKEKEEEQGRAWSATTLSQARLDWTQELVNRQANAQPGAPDFTPTMIKDFDAYSAKIIAAAPTSSAKNFIQQRMDELRANVGGQAIHFEAQARVDWRTDQFSKAIDNTSKLMNTDPSQYREALAEVLSLIDTSALPPIQKSALREKAAVGVSSAAVWSQIQKSPTAFLQSIGFEPSADGKTRKSAGDLNGVTGNAAFDMLPFDKRAALFEGAIRLKSQIDMDADRAAIAKQKQLGDDAMRDVWERWGKGKLTMQYLDTVRPLISPAEYHSALVAMKSGAAGGQKTDPGVFRELLRLQQADPQAAESYAYQQHKNGNLSNEHLSSEVNRIRTQGRQEGPKSPYEQGREFIRMSMEPGPFVQDPLGKSRYAEAIGAFDQWVQSGKRTDEEIRKRSNEIVGQYKFISFSDSAMTLPSPRSGNIRRNPSDTAGVNQDIVAAATAAKAKLDSKQFTKAEYDSEMQILNRWRKAVEAASHAK